METFAPSPPLSVLRHFETHTRNFKWHRAPSGFSGAVVWRGDSDTPRVALKAWPRSTTRERVLQIHAWLARAAHLPFVPTVFAGTGNKTTCLESGRVYDCCRWQPGTPRLAPTVPEVEAACAAVARLHEVWASSEIGPCPGVRNRLRILKEVEPLLRAGPDAVPPVAPQLDPLLKHAVNVAGRLASLAASALRQWEHREFVLQPCVRDLRAEHVLFEEDRVTGIVDFGATEVDSPAVDLARLLGDYAIENEVMFRAGSTSYRNVRSAFGVPDELIFLLARSGVLCSLLGWLVRLILRREPIPDTDSLHSRVARLLVRTEQITRF